MRCPECGYKAEADYRYCQRCGHPLSAVSQTTPRTSDNRRAEVSGKRRLWQRITFGLDKSIGGCIALIVVGVIICSIGYMMLSWSTLLQWSGMRTSEYVRLYRQTGLMPWQWCLAVIGIAINITGIVVTYIAISESGFFRIAETSFASHAFASESVIVMRLFAIANLHVLLFHFGDLCFLLRREPLDDAVKLMCEKVVRDRVPRSSVLRGFRIERNDNVVIKLQTDLRLLD